MGDDENILSGILDKLGLGAEFGAGYLATEKLAGAQRGFGEEAMSRAEGLGRELASASAGTFKPFTVSTGLAPSLQVTQEGIGFTTPEAGSYEAQRLADARALARSGEQQLAGTVAPQALQTEQERIQGMLLGPGIGTAQQDVFSQLQAMRAPEQERQRLALENRLFQQGRTGVRTAQYGGTPEQLAFEKAIQEQQAADALMARQQAVSEQQQTAGLIAQALGQGRAQQALQAELGLGAAQAAFLPQQQALSMLTGGTPFSELATRAGLQGIITQGELQQAGLQGLLEGMAGATLTEQQYLQNLLGGIFGSDGSGDSSFTGFLKDILLDYGKTGI